MKNLVFAVLVLQLGCYLPTQYAGPSPLATEDASPCPSFSGTTTVSWSRHAANADARLGISEDGRAPFTQVLDEAKVPSGYFQAVIDANGRRLPHGVVRCTQAKSNLSVSKCEVGTVRVVDEQGRALANMNVALTRVATYFRYGRTDQEGQLSGCFFDRVNTHVHGPGMTLVRREGQTFIMRPAEQQTVLVVDQEGRPISGVEVTLLRFEGWPEKLSMWSDQRGLVRLETDPVGTPPVRTEFRKRGYATVRKYALRELGDEIVLRPARIVRIVPASPKGNTEFSGRDLKCGNFEAEETFDCEDESSSWVCECPVGPANIFVDYHAFTVPAQARAVAVNLSKARNGIRGKIRDWDEGCELRSRQAGFSSKILVDGDGVFAHPALAPSLEYSLELTCGGPTRTIENVRIGWQWRDLGKI